MVKKKTGLKCHFGFIEVDGRCVPGQPTAIADICLAIDTSYAIGDTNLDLVKGFMQLFVENLDVNKDRVRVAIVGFGRMSHVYGHFRNYPNKVQAVTQLSKLHVTGGEYGNTAAALYTIRKEVFSTANGARDKTVAKVIVMIGAGKSSNLKNAEHEAAEVRKISRFYYIGVGNVDVSQIWGLTYQEYWFIVNPHQLIYIWQTMLRRMLQDMSCSLGYSRVQDKCFKLTLQFACPIGFSRNYQTCTFHRCPPGYKEIHMTCNMMRYTSICPPGYDQRGVGHCIASDHPLCPPGTILEPPPRKVCNIVKCPPGAERYGDMCVHTGFVADKGPLPNLPPHPHPYPMVPDRIPPGDLRRTSAHCPYGMNPHGIHYCRVILCPIGSHLGIDRKSCVVDIHRLSKKALKLLMIYEIVCIRLQNILLNNFLQQNHHLDRVRRAGYVEDIALHIKL
ncbi:uncharacterized protein LOC141915374 [Tubulanus polymorphus]|uniref:uncharacterized protein LOC141915374 n=1 Tax=Tubulanus polymorphus TaxID=672921 RepID=UPI003DA348EA